MGKEVLSAELEASKRGGMGETGAMDEGLMSEVRGFLNFELRTQNSELRLAHRSQVSRE